MKPSRQTVETRPAPPSGLPRWGRRRRRIDRLRAVWDTTPGKLRVARIILVLGILLAGSVAALDANSRVDTTRDIAEHLEPLTANVTTLYRSLADADATVALAFLSSGVESVELRQQYEQDRDLAADELRKAAAQIGEEPGTVSLIAGISQQLPVYTGYVERVRANNRQGNTAGRAYLGLASELMRDTILPQAAELQRQQVARLDDAYRRAGSVPVVALAAGAVSLAGLIWAQVFVFRRTHRVVNLGLAAASGAVLAGLVWWMAAGVASAAVLQSSHRHVQAVSNALGPAQIAALQARAIETNRLVFTGSATEKDFTNQLGLLETNLHAARRFDPDQEARSLVMAAADDARDYATAHTTAHTAAGADLTGATAAFRRLDAALSAAVDRERTAFRDDMQRARGWWLTGLSWGTGWLALAATVGVALGVQQRLEEYR
ncbi:MAG: hypothetical protein ACRDSR_23710 [Pseudonocardiaceae bacterium]